MIRFTGYHDPVMKNESNQHWDLIGDIHGQLEPLRRLLDELGYREEGGGVAHPAGRRLIFVGDLIDRGPASRGVLELVRRLVDSGVALVVMGNHEYNFVAYHTEDDAGNKLREHTEKNMDQVQATLESFDGHEEEIPGWVEWMKALPFYLDLGGLRVVHAAWVPGDIAYLADKTLLEREFLIESARRGSRAWEAIERVLKGPELLMPDGLRVVDSGGKSRAKMRARWWGGIVGLSWREISFPFIAELPDGEAVLAGFDELLDYGPGEPPVFFGHYKLTHLPVEPQADNVASLDYGLGHGGAATAYRWSGEKVIAREQFVQVAPAARN
jgi:hypothetical protein